MLDLDIRIRNLRETHARLVKLLDKSDKVEDLLKTEKELQRVTEALELLQGRTKYLNHAVAYSTLTVHLNSPVPQTELQEVVPFAWVRNLATEVIVQPNASFDSGRHRGKGPKLTLPASYAKLHVEEGYLRAMSGSGVLVLVQRERNIEGGTLAFWSTIVRRWLESSKVIAITDSKEVTVAGGARGRTYVGTKTMGGKLYKYVLLVVVNEDHIHTCEAWGLAETLNADQADLESSFRSLKVKP